MKFLATLFLILFCFHFDGIESHSQIIEKPPSQDDESSHIVPSLNATTTAPEKDFLETISLDDFSSSGENRNNKIEQNIIDNMKNMPNKFFNYRLPMNLTILDYSCPKKSVNYTYDTGKGRIFFHDANTMVCQSCNQNNDEYFISVGCDSPSTARISVGSLPGIKILADFSITLPLVESTKHGVITITLRNGTITKQIKATNRTANNTEEEFFLLFIHTNIDVEFEGPQKLVYNKVETYLDEVILSSLRDHFAKQLNKQMEERKLNLLSDCPKILQTEPSDGKVNSSFFYSPFNNIYVVPEMKLRIQLWQGVNVTLAPIVIDGFSFNGAELSVSKRYDARGEARRYMVLRVESKSLKGKFHWNCSLDRENDTNAVSVFSVSFDNILFQYDLMEHYRTGYTQHINVYLGKPKLKPSKSTSYTTRLKFVEFVVSEYLKPAIAKSLKTSLSEKANDAKRFFVSSLLAVHYL